MQIDTKSLQSHADCHWLISDHVVFTTLNAIKDTVSYNHKEYEVQYG